MTMRQAGGRRMVRLGKLVAGCLFCAYVLLVLFAQIEVRVERHRAERLITEMRGLTVGKSNWDDLQGVRARWGKFGREEGACTPAACEYWIEVGDTAIRSRVDRALLWMGHARSSESFVQIQLREGLVTRASYSLWVAVPSGYGPRWEAQRVKEDQMVPYSTGGGYALIARANQTTTLPELCCDERGKRDHPQYVLSRPGGCENCLAIFTDFKASASRRDQDRMTDFNFSCMTRWRPCRDEEDIMPDAGREYEAQVEEERIEYKREAAREAAH